ncbi:MAG: alpha/beta hydrolase [Gemmatimonadota bacterium]|nr:MAG: alpha/beta hydrolase [Gemmatimonadota bacterium]
MTLRAPFFYLVLATSAAHHACNEKADDTVRGGLSAPPDAFVTANGVRLHYLDWGGTGPELVLVHGLQDSPHIFDHLAAGLSDDFRVIAYARRGHGQSDAPADPYDNATLVEDLRELLDSLGIAQANLLGWSMGGNEITEFAGKYPDRTIKLVYLEAGYDWSDVAFWEAFEQIPIASEPDSASLQSLAAYRAWYQAHFPSTVTWTSGLEAHLRDITRIASDGTVQTIPNETVSEKLLASLAATGRDYARVRAPALALYSSTLLDTDVSDPQRAHAITTWEQQMIAPFRRASIERIRRELPGVVVSEIPNTTHMSIGLVSEETVTATIRRFLLESQ